MEEIASNTNPKKLQISNIHIKCMYVCSFSSVAKKQTGLKKRKKCAQVL